MSTNGLISQLQRLAPPATQWDLAIRQALYDLRVALPCQVVSFNAAQQTVVLQPLIRENVALPPDLVSTPVAIPQLLDVPVLFPQTAAWAVTFPIQPGDECLAVFMDMCADAWELQGGLQNQIFQRRHDLSDAVAVFGLRSQPNALSNYSTTKLQIRSADGHTRIDISGADIKLTPDNGTTFVELTPGHVVITPDGGTSKIDVTAGITNVIGVLKVNGVVVTVP